MQRPDMPENNHIHMIGIGGAGVSGLAVILNRLGYRVTGSDLKTEAIVPRLTPLGIEVQTGHRAENVGHADLVVASAAVPDDNPEMVAARNAGIPVWSRARMLGRLMKPNYSVAVSGTHGKTTTSALLGMVLEAGGLDPTVVVGGDVQIYNGNAKAGGSNYFVAEACEAFNSFLEIAPDIAIVTNIEADHLDCHGSLQGVIESFRTFLSGIRPGGCAVMCADCPNTSALIPALSARIVTYGTGSADCRAFDADISLPEPVFSAEYLGRRLGTFTLGVPGIHNVRNALSAIAVACELGVSVEAIADALRRFKGAGRRFEVLGEARGIVVIDDYAHHPTEVAATLDAALSWGRRVVAVFQPHLFSRTRLFCSQFAESLLAADSVVLTEIFPSREQPVPGVSASSIVDVIEADRPGLASFIPDKQDIPRRLAPELREGDMVVFMGAGDIRSAGEALLEELRR